MIFRNLKNRKDGWTGLVTAVLLTVFSLHTQASPICFQNIRAENSALSINDIRTITQDDNGFIWIGTAEGLHRYDGRRFHIYDKTSPGLPSSFIVSLLSDDGGLWIGTDCGVAYYDRTSDRIEHFDCKSDLGTSITGKATVITRDNIGNVWFAVNEQGVFRYSPVDKKLINYFGTSDAKLPANVRTIYFYPDGRCLVGLYYMGLYSADWAERTLEPAFSGADGDFFAGDNIVGIVPGSSGAVYTLSPGRGLVEIDNEGTPRSIFRPDGDFEPNSLSSDANYNLWMSTLEGVYRVNRLRGDIEIFQRDETDPHSLPENSVSCVLSDSYGGTWVGTSGSGLAYANPSGRNFKKIYVRSVADKASAVATSLSADEEGRLWCATNRGGLYTISAGGKNISHVNADLPSELFSVCAGCDRVWVTALDGIYSYDPATHQVHHYDRLNPAEPLKEFRLASLCCLPGDRLLVATTLGLYYYNFATDNFGSFDGLSKCYVTGVAPDSDGTYWVSTFAHGLIHYDPLERKIITNYRHSEEPGSLPCDKIMDVTVDSKGSVWVSTFGAGVARLRKDGGFDVFSRNNSGGHFPANVTFQTFEDGLGQLWITTNKGLVALDPSTGNTTTYTSAQGLLNDDLSYRRGVRTLDGSIYLCSIEGITMFKPLEFKNKPRSHRPVITDLYIDGVRIETSENGSPLKCNPDMADRLNLSENDRNIELLISDPSFLSADVSAKAYYRLGDSDEWRRIPDDGHLVFPYLPAGDHILQFREVDSDGSEVLLHAPLQLHVAQMFYKTPFAMFLYILLISSGIYFLWNYTSRRNKRNIIRASEELKKRQEIDAYNEKMALFSSVVNRLRAPLALIRNPLENILRTHKDNADLTNDLMVISNGADRLSRLLNEFSDFHADECSYILDKRPIGIYKVLSEKINALADDSGIEITLEGDENLLVEADRDGLYRLVEAMLIIVKPADFAKIEVLSYLDNMVAISVLSPGIPLAEAMAEDIMPLAETESQNKNMDLIRSSIPVMKLLVNLHGGSIALEAPGEADYTFRVLLPEAKMSEDDSTASDTTGTVLLIEESENSLGEIQQKLSETFRVVAVQSTVVAADLLHRDRYCAVIAEATPRKPMGINICRQLTADVSFGADVPVVVIAESGPDHSLSKEAFIAGAAMVVEKPADASYVVECVRAAVRRAGTASTDSMLLITGDGSVQPVSDDDVRFIQALDRVVAENIADAEFDNEQLAAKMCMSKSTLIRRTKKALATTPKDYLLRKRLALAAEMLVRSAGRINEVCYAAGFNTPSYFAKCFRRVYGCLPSEYKGGPPKGTTDMPVENQS